MPNTAQVANRPSEPTYCEKLAATTWGSYLTGVEMEMLLQAEKLARPASRAIEVGSEGGRWSRMMADLGWKMTCTDITPETLKICQEKIPDATCVLADPNGTMLPGEAGDFGLLLSIEVFPVMQSSWFLAEAHRVLKNGGIMAGICLNRSSWRGFQAVARGKFSRKPMRFYTRSYPEWRKSAIAQGFELLYERGFSWSPFSRASNSPLVPLFTRAERRLGFGRLTLISPWIAFIARKKSS